jgi:putative toxin-antitoxin system antitoxin component (TIGR02293 family)
MTMTTEVVEVLGGKAALGIRGDVERLDLHDRIRRGLPYSALQGLTARFRLPKGQLSVVLGLPPSTEVRRKKARKLSQQESDRLFRLARVLALARLTLGSDEAAATWLQESNRALGGATPLDLLETAPGAHEVETILGRLDYGVIS